jgi:hypothetical protein
MPTLYELTSKLLHEETKRELRGKKQKDTETLWVKFCKRSNEKKWLHGGHKHGESKNHNFEKKVVTTSNQCYKPGHWAKNYAMPFEEVLKI